MRDGGVQGRVHIGLGKLGKGLGGRGSPGMVRNLSSGRRGGAAVVGTFRTDTGILTGCGTTRGRKIERVMGTPKVDGVVVSVEGGSKVLKQKICASWSIASSYASPILEMGKAGCGLWRAKQRSITARTAASAEKRAGIFP